MENYIKMSEEYEIKTENFEGPYDLFLFLIENKKMDFSKIVISTIIDEYLKIIDNEKRGKRKRFRKAYSRI